MSILMHCAIVSGFVIILTTTNTCALSSIHACEESYMPSRVNVSAEMISPTCLDSNLYDGYIDLHLLNGCSESLVMTGVLVVTHMLS